MKAAFGAIVLAAALAASPAIADPVADPDPAPARSSTSMAGGRWHPLQAWAGIGYYNTGVSVNVPGFGSVSGSTGQFGFNGGASYAFPINPDLSWLGFGNIALAFGDVTSIPITVGGGVRGEHLGPIQLSGLAGFTLAPISGGNGTKAGLALGAQANFPTPQLMPGVGIQAAFMYHILTDSFSIWTINAGLSYILPY
jgi:hypothetical protein